MNRLLLFFLMLVKRYKVDSIRLERLVFKHKIKKYYLVAGAYDGKYIRQCISKRIVILA